MKAMITLNCLFVVSVLATHSTANAPPGEVRLVDGDRTTIIRAGEITLQGPHGSRIVLKSWNSGGFGKSVPYPHIEIEGPTTKKRDHPASIILVVRDGLSEVNLQGKTKSSRNPDKDYDQWMADKLNAPTLNLSAQSASVAVTAFTGREPIAEFSGTDRGRMRLWSPAGKLVADLPGE
jgi:hypothetical protein